MRGTELGCMCNEMDDLRENRQPCRFRQMTTIDLDCGAIDRSSAQRYNELSKAQGSPEFRNRARVSASAARNVALRLRLYRD